MKKFIVLLFTLIASSLMAQSVRIAPDSAFSTWARAITFTWDAVDADDTLYCIQIASTSIFTTKLVDDSTHAVKTYAWSSFNVGTTYYWRVKTKTAGDSVPGTWSAFSTAWPFIVEKYPSLTSPINASTKKILPLTFNWEDTVTPADTLYHLQVASSGAFSVLYVNDSTRVVPYKSVTWLPSGATVYWRVRVKMKGDTLPAIWSSYSSTWNTSLYSMEVQSLKAPTNNSNYWVPPVTFTWRGQTSDSIWEAQVATSKSFATSTIAIDTTIADSTFAGSLDSATTYYWRVRPWITGGAWASYSPVWKFKTVYATPAVLTLNYPHDLAKGVDTAFTFTWVAGTRDSLYRIQVATDANFTSIAKQDSCLVPSYAITALTGSTTYYWRVKTRNKSGEGAYCVRQRFTTRSTKHK